MVPAVVKEKRPWARALLAALALAGAGGEARAHPEVSPQLVNRYLSLIVVGDRVEFFVTLLHGALPGAEARRALDRDGDGRISEAERLQGQADWQRRAPELATISIDGAPIPLTDASADLQLGPDISAGPAPLVVEVYGSRPLPPGTRVLRLEPGRDPPRLGETEMVLDLAVPGWQLVSSRQGDGPEQRLTRYKLDGPAPGERSATFTIRSTAPPPRRSPLPIVAAVLAALGALGLALELRRRRQRS
jgi:hypothetical protein